MINKEFLPRRIILVRHGESQGNLDGSTYATTPDNKVPLTELGMEQARLAGAKIREVISSGGELSNWKVYFYVSPYARTRSTLRGIGRSFSKRRVIGVREECRIREQDFGNFQASSAKHTNKVYSLCLFYKNAVVESIRLKEWSVYTN